jgi:hypothetical protein
MARLVFRACGKESRILPYQDTSFYEALRMTISVDAANASWEKFDPNNALK